MVQVFSMVTFFESLKRGKEVVDIQVENADREGHKLVKTCYFKCNFKGNGRKVKYSALSAVLKKLTKGDLEK